MFKSRYNTLELDNQNFNYKAFINYAIDNCDSFSVVLGGNLYYQEILNKYKEELIDVRKILIHPDTGTDFNGALLAKFKCNSNMRSFLLMADNVFDWNGANLPEELCFYRQNNIWFKSICHEHLLFIINANGEDEKYLKSHNFNFYYA